ncbi:MAG: hypothetical protein ACI9TY_000651 [Alphaproteobacteria bacterium]|jgi:hypothetical protein
MATKDQMSRAAQASKDNFENALDKSFDDGADVSEKVFSLVAGRGEDAGLPDHVMIQYVFKYNELMSERQDAVLNDVNPYDQNADIQIQSMAVSALLAEDDISESFGELKAEIDSDRLTERLSDALHAKESLSMFMAEQELEDSLEVEPIGFETQVNHSDELEEAYSL